MLRLNLPGVDDKTYRLDDFADAQVLVVIFTCNHCPVAVDYEDRLVDLQDDYADNGVQLVAINVNNQEADKLPAMKQRSQKKGFTFTTFTTRPSRSPEISEQPSRRTSSYLMASVGSLT